MPRLIDADSEERMELGDLIEALETSGFDPRDEEGFASWGPALRKLANNRDFLAELIVAELKAHCANQLHTNAYNSQVVMLYAGSTSFMLRANLWPSLTDSIVVNSGTSPFFYGVPHDHNFSFLTVGYLGPGYWSDYYEYDYEKVLGHAGEDVDLQFVERSRLNQGKVMLYRAHKDVHLQLPADSMSVSLNIVEVSQAEAFRDQYRFDIDNRRIERIMSPVSVEPLLQLAAHFGGEEGIDLLDTFSQRHPSDRMRFEALKARAGATKDFQSRLGFFDRATDSDNPYVSAMAGRELKRLESAQSWIEGAARSIAA